MAGLINANLPLPEQRQLGNLLEKDGICYFYEFTEIYPSTNAIRLINNPRAPGHFYSLHSAQT